ncbi:MAG: manganese efflux pump [Clostridia bacterium]|nr:manganese efflux pump [Clostridia bacterium]
MPVLDWILIGVALSMDAAAVSMCKGLATGRVKPRHCLVAGGYFGFFQGLMPAIGYCLGYTFAGFITRYAHWVAFILLALIGANMLRESFSDEEACQSCSFSPATMLPLAVATSIDALAVGVSFAVEGMTWMQMLTAVAIIGCITLVISAVAVWIGSLFGTGKSHVAERVGGTILVLIGLKILLEGLGCWPF